MRHGRWLCNTWMHEAPSGISWQPLPLAEGLVGSLGGGKQQIDLKEVSPGLSSPGKGKRTLF